MVGRLHPLPRGARRHPAEGLVSRAVPRVSQRVSPSDVDRRRPAAFSGFCSYTNGTRLDLHWIILEGGERCLIDDTSSRRLGRSTREPSHPTALLCGRIDQADDASALIVIDVQNCFMPGGSLAVKEGDRSFPSSTSWRRRFENVVMTQDWHTPGHVSFASSHAGKKPFETSRAPLRQAGAVARPLRAGHRRRRAAQGPGDAARRSS